MLGLKPRPIYHIKVDLAPGSPSIPQSLTIKGVWLAHPTLYTKLLQTRSQVALAPASVCSSVVLIARVFSIYPPLSWFSRPRAPHMAQLRVMFTLDSPRCP